MRISPDDLGVVAVHLPGLIGSSAERIHFSRVGSGWSSAGRLTNERECAWETEQILLMHRQDTVGRRKTQSDCTAVWAGQRLGKDELPRTNYEGRKAECPQPGAAQASDRAAGAVALAGGLGNFGGRDMQCRGIRGACQSAPVNM
jgi:hypothetical protein